jgi:hypothetical protein
MTGGEKTGGKGLWRYLRGLVKLTLFLAALLFALSVGHSRYVKNRADTFCNSFAIGAPFDLAKFEAQAKQVPNTRLFIYPQFFSEGNGTVWARFQGVVPGFHICKLGIVDGIVVTREVQFRN